MFKVEWRTCLYQFWIYEDNELQWEHQLERMLSVLHQDDHEILSDIKSSQWEVLDCICALAQHRSHLCAHRV